MVSINSNFSAGNIELVSRSSDNEVTLAIKADNQSEFKQWFYFKAHHEVGQTATFVIEDADKTAYPSGWEGYRVCCSYDGIDWFRIPTEYKDGELRFALEFEINSAFFAYFAPYSYERHQSLIQRAQSHPLCRQELLGETLDGREMNLLVIGEASAKEKVWLIARQHPGETMAEWFMEGFIDRLLDQDDALSRVALQNATFYLVPNMNPDGSERGHLRTNAKGINLNREWDKSTLENSPEVFLVKQAMDKYGVDMFIDVHGDEGLPYNFVACCEGIPSYNEEMRAKEEKFIHEFMSVSLEFQNEFGYPKDEPGKADLSIASSWVGENHSCLALTLEMPFKDNANLPDEEKGWSPERCFLLGESILHPIYQCLSGRNQ